MLNKQVILLGLLWVIFVAAAFGQEPSDSQFVEQINVVDLNNNIKELSATVKKLNEKTEKLSENVETLTASVNSLNTRVAVLEERTQGTAKIIHVILASFIGPLVVAIIAYFFTRNRIILSSSLRL